MATVAEKLLTAEEYAAMPDSGILTELVRGRVVEMPSPGHQHGRVCLKFGRLIGTFADDHNLGEFVGNDSGVITERGPDSVRGPDLAYYSFGLIARGEVITGYPVVKPELVVEVRSPSDRWPKILQKVGEYLDAGTLVVCVLDPKTVSAHLYRADGAPQILGPDDEFTVPEILPGLNVPVRKFFE